MDHRTPLVVVTGWQKGVRRLGRALLRPGTVLVQHDLTLSREGAVTRTVTTAETERVSLVALAHGCVSCTVRGDLLPLLRMLSDRSSVARIVLLLDSAMEPLEICQAINDVPVTGMVGRIDAPAAHDVRIAGVLTALDVHTWLADATGDESLGERLGLDDEDRTVARVAVAQAEFADALVLFGKSNPFDLAELNAVLNRLAPTAPRHWAAETLDIDAVIASAARVPRVERGFDPHAPLLAGSPPLEFEGGVGIVEFTAHRPFHPERLHEAIDLLLDGVVTVRGRVWLATRPNDVLWLESAGQGLRIGPAGRWLAAMSAADQQAQDPERLAMAALHWDARFGDRHTSLVLLVRGADPNQIQSALRGALVTDDQLRYSESWRHWPDSFGDWHEDPCTPTQDDTSRASAAAENNGHTSAAEGEQRS